MTRLAEYVHSGTSLQNSTALPSAILSYPVSKRKPSLTISNAEYSMMISHSLRSGT